MEPDRGIACWITARSTLKGSNILKRLLPGVLSLTAALAQGPNTPSRLVFRQTEYTVKAGDFTPVFMLPESLAFGLSAKVLTAKASGHVNRDFAVGSTVERDGIALGVPLTTIPGDYSVDISFASSAGEARTGTLRIKVEPFATPEVSAGSEPPVVLLDGWQFSCPIPAPQPGNPPSSVTFGYLQAYLGGPPNNVPAVYFFENCMECPTHCSIEQLGADLGAFLESLPYPQVDVVAHSMGGLIVRAYLSGKQTTSGVFSPPANPKIRKAVFVASPHFGAIAADYNLAELFATNIQTQEMQPGSQFVWDLGTWNQNRDDLRGVDAVSIVGVGASSGTSDGVVDSSSASLDFTMPGRTRVVSYCHIPPGAELGLAGFYLDCYQPGIAYVDSTSHPTYEIVSSFLMNGTAWQGVGNSPGEDPYLSKYGGMVVADIGSVDQFVIPSNFYWGTPGCASEANGCVELDRGGASELLYNDFASGAGTFNFGSSTCGPYTPTAGVYSTVRCKFSPVIYSVGPLMTGSAKVVAAGGIITINGVGFTSSTGTSLLANGSPLSGQVVSDQEITASLPSNYSGLVALVVSNSSGQDSINIFAALPARPPTIALSAQQLQFAYTTGGAVPASQSVTVSNSGGGTFTWSAAANVSWLTLSSAPGVLTVSINPAGVSAGPHSGIITITGTGAANSPQAISVNLTVSTPAAIALSATQANFIYTAGASAPPAQTISVSNAGGGSLAWVASANVPWLTVTPTGTAPSTITIAANPAGMNAAATPYAGTVTLTANGATNSPQSIAVSLTVLAASPSVLVTSVTNGASGVAGAITPGEIVTIKGSGLGPSAGVSFSVDPATGMVDAVLAGTRVLFGSIAAPITYTSAGQVNAIAPYEIAGQAQVTMQVQYQGATSGGSVLQVAMAAPGAFTFSGSGSGQAVALNQNGSINGASNPAAAGSYVTIYFTGGGPTNPPAVTGSVTGSVLEWLAQPITVTVGNVPAVVEFAGAAPTFVAGVGQLNIQLANGTPSGTQPLVITVGGIGSAATATLAVQ